MTEAVEYQTFSLKDSLYDRDTLLLRYDIRYPQFSSDDFSVGCINERYARQAAAYAQHCREELFRQAQEQRGEDTQTDAPIRVFEVVQAFEITMNEDCTLSLWFDRYEYTGGAHGNTQRTSDTWDVASCARIRLSAICSVPARCRDYIVGQITRQIEARMAEGDVFFDDYRRNATLYFCPNSFYLTPGAMVLYYQQYEIAPYSSGIPEFPIQYSAMIRKPDCT